ncbi:hypothetical protein [Limnoglobus roseus]|uniref:hypothetical protein n=1 Tax=Limnoglobus roseus TaxID=2598579 RepID=UPI0011EB6EF0|nr:hypothetical protein [Limnoglobus roseus]
MATIIIRGAGRKAPVPADQQGAVDPIVSMVVVGLLICLVFFVTGALTIQCKPRGLKGLGIVSLLFSLMFIFFSVFGIFASFAAGLNRPAAVIFLIGSSFLLLFGLGLMIAGILALSSNAAYQDWREVRGLNRMKPRRRRDSYEDDSPDRPRRRDASHND